MSPRSAGRTVIVCILALGVSAAEAQLPRIAKGVKVPDRQIRVHRRPVAVIDLTNLTNDQSVRDVANRLLELLASHTELAPPAISDGAALVDRVPMEDQRRLDDAEKKRVAAEVNLAQRNFREAAIDAVEGQELLLHVTPRLALGLYADLALALGQSRLGEKKDAEAREAFALTYRLDPRRTLDDLHYLPEVVQAFEAAKKMTPGVGTIAVRGAGKVWIDGEEVGRAPGEFKASYGRHVVWLTDLLRETAGKEVLVTPTRQGVATIMDGPLTRPQKVYRYRMALSQADSTDATQQASAMQALATFINVHDAVLLSLAGGKVQWQAWSDRAGFTAKVTIDREGPIEVIRHLAPPRPVEPEPVVLRPLPIERRWYQQRSVQVGLAASIVAAVIGGYFWVHYTEAPRPWNTDIKAELP